MAETLPGAEVAVEDMRPRLTEELIHQKVEEDPRSFAHAEEDRLAPAVAEKTDSGSNPQDTQAPLSNEARIAKDNPAQQFAADKPLKTEAPSPEMAQLSTADQAGEATVEKTVINELDLEDSEPANDTQFSEEILAIPTHAEFSEPQTETRQNMPLAPQGESPISADTTLTVDTLNSPFQLKEVEILMPSVKRFLLVKSVSNREPKGELNEISFTADGSAAVWVYSELINRKGSRLKYVWLHGGKRIVTVPVNVGGNRWRSSSSKVINQSMSGAWRVELQDGKGRLMASADFFVK
jgi:hypothetical protein